MARKTKEEALKTYHCLLDVSAELFSTCGISNTTLGDIATAAEMTRGAVYWHFKNKDDVIKALWERDALPVVDKFLNQLSSMGEEPDKNFRNTLKDMMREIAHNPTANQAIRITLNSSEAIEQQSELQVHLESQAGNIYSGIEAAINRLAKQGYLREDLAPELLSAALWSYLHGLVDTSLRSHISQVNLQKDSDTLIDIMLDAFIK